MGRIGDLDQRVTIQKPRYDRDGLGDEKIAGEDTVATVWAKITAVGGTEGPEGTQLVGRESYIVRIRTRSDLTPQHNFVHRGRVIEIDSVPLTSPRDPYMDIPCTATGANPT